MLDEHTPPDLYTLEPCPRCGTRYYATAYKPQLACLTCLNAGVKTVLRVLPVYICRGKTDEQPREAKDGE